MERVKRDEILKLARRAELNGQRDLRNLLLTVAGIVDRDGKADRMPGDDERFGDVVSPTGPFGIGLNLYLERFRG